MIKRINSNNQSQEIFYFGIYFLVLGLRQSDVERQHIGGGN